jgi:transposase-like protein
MTHTTIIRRVHRFAPEFERRCNRFARPVGHSWRVEKTDVKIRVRVDRDGKTVDFRLSTRRGVAAARAYFRKAIRRQESTPRIIALDCDTGIAPRCP